MKSLLLQLPLYACLLLITACEKEAVEVIPTPQCDRVSAFPLNTRYAELCRQHEMSLPA